MSEVPAILSEQLGLGENTTIGVLVLIVAAIGIVVGLRQRPTLDGPLGPVAGLSALAISTHFRQVDGYWFQITPWSCTSPPSDSSPPAPGSAPGRPHGGRVWRGQRPLPHFSPWVRSSSPTA